jgi:mRNA-degrading endonuclease toxin of MazEF toxin-antitoxin module
MRAAKIFCLILALALSAANAQSPTPIVVQAATAKPVTSASSIPVATTDTRSIQDAIALLEKIKAANDEVLAKQKAALERLDELQEAADQLRIFSKRG